MWLTRSEWAALHGGAGGEPHSASLRIHLISRLPRLIRAGRRSVPAFVREPGAKPHLRLLACRSQASYVPKSLKDPSSYQANPVLRRFRCLRTGRCDGTDVSTLGKAIPMSPKVMSGGVGDLANRQSFLLSMGPIPALFPPNELGARIILNKFPPARTAAPILAACASS